MEKRRKKQGGADTDFARIADKYKLPLDFSGDVLQEAERASKGHKAELEARPAVTGWVITIDSESAKDLDDAVSVEKSGFGYELGVHIADVSWYVAKGSRLDREALERGTSVYLIDKVVPMFPPRLSNDLCSLNADRPKLCFSAFLSISRSGEVKAVRFARTRVQVNRRFSYKEVEAILNGQADPDKKKLELMGKLARLLRKRRIDAGSLLFDVPEIKIELDKAGVPVSVKVPERLESEGIVEEFMLAANQQVAGFLAEKGPSIYRIHEDPDEEKLKAFFDFAARMGVSLKQPGKISPLGMQRILDTIRSNPAAGVLNSMLIRSLQKAVYSTDNPGHFGLAFTTYTHFTSPIRRYPDLIVHRLLGEVLTGTKAYGQKKLQEIAAKATEREQLASEAEREIVRIKGARFLEQYIGQSIEGRITSVAVFGAFLTLIPFGLDGMLHVAQMGHERWELDPYGHSLVTKGGKRLSIGDTVRIRILRVDPLKGFVDLTLDK
jgi:ribonuclease R